MNERDITSITRGMAPVIEELLRRCTEPLVQRIAQLERDIAAARRPEGLRRVVSSAVDAALPIEVRGAVNIALPSLVAAAVADAVAALPAPAPGKDADPEAIRQMVSEAVAALPAAEPGKDADPELVRELIVAEVARLPPPPAGKDADPEWVHQLVAEAVASLPAPQPGKDADPEIMRQMIADAVAALPAPEPGKDADPAEVERLVTETVERTLAGWERPKDGTSVTIDEVAPMIERAVTEAVAALPQPEPGKPGAPGKLGMVRAWEDRVFYEAEVTTFDGALYQAQRDTGHAPPHEDWLCIVSRGEAGADARQIDITGTYDVTRTYSALNVVALNGGSFIAKRDNPGPCPGDGWQLVASQGNRGKPGDAVKGDPGRPGPSVRAIEVDDQAMLTLKNADGSEVRCDLYPLLAKIASS